MVLCRQIKEGMACLMAWVRGDLDFVASHQGNFMILAL